MKPNIMFNISNINAGWLKLRVGDKEFHASYLTDVKEELDYLFDFESCAIKNDTNVRRIHVDGEGVDLYLTAWKIFDQLIVVWEDDVDNPNSPLFDVDIFHFNYEEFMQKYYDIWDNVIEDYNKYFKYDHFLDVID